MAEQLESMTGLEAFACLSCRQRKIKCNRHNPCSNCDKTGKTCSFIPPVRGKRKRTKPPKEGLHVKLRRYEKMLKSYGVKIEPDEDEDDSDLETASPFDVEMSEDTKSEIKDEGAMLLEETKSILVTKDGSSRYFDSAPWSKLGDKSHPEESGVAESTDESDVSDSDMFLGSLEPNGLLNAQDLASLHPSVQVLSKLWAIYVDRIDHLIKHVHLPTFWTSLVNGVNHPRDIPRDLKAMIFAFYLVVVNSLGEDECQNLFGGPKSVIFARYKLAARQTLMQAGFLQTSSLMTLRAYTMFLMAIRSTHQNDTLFTLSGVTVRLARRMGLHRDGTSLGLSPFETEMRRRLWWHIVHVDCRVSDLLGTKPSSDLFSGDTKMPLNVADEDLSPDMVDPPQERNGITPIVICLIKCEILDFIRNLSSSFPSDVGFEKLRSSDISLAQKDSMINQIEDRLERKYLRYCDPSNSLHLFASIMARSSICKMRLFAHNPRRFAIHGVKMPQNERDIILENATKLLEYLNLMRGNPILDKYKWQLGTNYLLDTILYVLIEARHRKTGPEVDRLWQLIGVVLPKYPQIFEDTTKPVFNTLGKWILEAWDHYIAATRLEGLPEPSPPESINAFRRCRRLSPASLSKVKAPAESKSNPTNLDGNNDILLFGQDADTDGSFDALASYDFSDLLSFEMDPNEWARWDSEDLTRTFIT